MQKINALSCSKPIQFAIDHLYDFSHNILNLLNILSRTVRLPQSFLSRKIKKQAKVISKRSRSKQKQKAAYEEVAIKTPIVVIFDVELFLSIVHKTT